MHRPALIPLLVCIAWILASCGGSEGRTGTDAGGDAVDAPLDPGPTETIAPDADVAADPSPDDSVTTDDGSGEVPDVPADLPTTNDAIVDPGSPPCVAATYAQPWGAPCRWDSECAEPGARCVEAGYGRYCTNVCALHADCPDGSVCTFDRGADARVCLALFPAAVGQGDWKMADYGPCWQDKDCVGGICAGYCSRSCSPDDAGQDPVCGPCGVCLDTGVAVDAPPTQVFRCHPRGSQQFGTLCTWDGDCESRVCGRLYYWGPRQCLQPCIPSATQDECPSGHWCGSDTYPTGRKGCRSNERLLGDSCTWDKPCLSGTCTNVFSLNPAVVCTSACPQGVCDQGTCIVGAGGRWCVPTDWIGEVGDDGGCLDAFQCGPGLECREWATGTPTCQRPCDAAGGCGSRTCGPEGFCITSCTGDPDCGFGSQCGRDGRCHRFDPTYVGRYPDGQSCRSDWQCSSGHCVDLRCATTCSPSEPCLGSGPYSLESLGFCQPCQPFLAGKDCESPDPRARMFCLPDRMNTWSCLLNSESADWGGCSPGAQWQRFDAYVFSSTCLPFDGACGNQPVCGQDGLCHRQREPGEACDDGEFCRTGACLDGRCRIPCDTDGDCGCRSQACVDGSCRIRPDGSIREAEPDDAPADAMVLEDDNGTLYGALQSRGVDDRDFYRIAVPAGSFLELWVDDRCADGPWTRDWGPQFAFSLQPADATTTIDRAGTIRHQAQSAGDVLVEVYRAKWNPDWVWQQDEDDPYRGYWWYRGSGMDQAYTMRWQITPAASNIDCARALPLEPGAHQISMLSSPISAYGKCPGSTAVCGPWLAFQVDIPARRVARLALSTRGTFDAWWFDRCPELGSSGKAVMPDQPRVSNRSDAVLSWWNGGDSTVSTHLFLTPGVRVPDDALRLDLTFDEAPSPAGDAVPIEVPAPGETRLDTLVGAADDPLGPRCDESLPGPDVSYQVTLQPGQALDARLTGLAGTVLILREPDGGVRCQSSPGSVGYLATGPGPVTVGLVVDTREPRLGDQFQLSIVFDDPAECLGSCDPTLVTARCLDTHTLCQCSGGFLARTTCPVERPGSATVPLCVGTNPGFCVTRQGCDPPDRHWGLVLECISEDTTGCPCGASDPCRWIGDGVCQSWCQAWLPVGSLDDSADCGQ